MYPFKNVQVQNKLPLHSPIKHTRVTIFSIKTKTDISYDQFFDGH